jgi:hypothetical protein
MGVFRGKSRSNGTHESGGDPDSRQYRKGKTTSELRFMRQTLMENRNDLVVEAMVTKANGIAERQTTKTMVTQAHQAHQAHHAALRSRFFWVPTEAKSRPSSFKLCK